MSTWKTIKEKLGYPPPVSATVFVETKESKPLPLYYEVTKAEADHYYNSLYDHYNQIKHVVEEDVTFVSFNEQMKQMASKYEAVAVPHSYNCGCSYCAATNGTFQQQNYHIESPEWAVSTYSPFLTTPKLQLIGNDDQEMDEVHYSSNSNDWNTPEEVFEWLKPLGQMRLDPCSNAHSCVPAILKWHELGLNDPWDVLGNEKGYVFVNPPYAREIGKWITKAILEHKERDVEIVLLVPARTDTRWYQAVMSVTSAVCFVKGRIAFDQNGVKGTMKAPFPSAFIYLGKRSFLFCEALKSKGWCIAS